VIYTSSFGEVYAHSPVKGEKALRTKLLSQLRVYLNSGGFYTPLLKRLSASQAELLPTRKLIDLSVIVGWRAIYRGDSYGVGAVIEGEEFKVHRFAVVWHVNNARYWPAFERKRVLTILLLQAYSAPMCMLPKDLLLYQLLPIAMSLKTVGEEDHL
jgi:hypothetical protein